LIGGQEGHLWEVSSGKEIRSLGLKKGVQLLLGWEIGAPAW
jgi:hypothetical protein